MKYDFHVHDAVRVEYRVTTDAPSFPRGHARIEREVRSPGGNGVLAACALARWGARVLLTGNAIGDDAHGRFLVERLAQVSNLTFEPRLESGLATPYALLLRAGTHSVGVLLSPSAASLPMPNAPDATRAHLFFGHGGAEVMLPGTTQDYAALLGSLEAVAAFYLSLLEEVSDDDRRAFIARVTGHYKEGFGGLETILSLEEIEASLSAER